MSFQSVYDFIKKIKTPMWLRELLQELQDLMFSVLRKAGEAYIAYLETLIIQAMNKPNLTNEQKFKYVFDNARNAGVKALIELKDNELNALINTLYATLKASL